jgi:hypothetical protein
MQRLTEILDTSLQKRGFSLNTKPGKTEWLLSACGLKSRELNVDLLGNKEGRISLDALDPAKGSIGIATSYEYCGSIIDYKRNLVHEIKRRAALAYGTAAPLVPRFFAKLRKPGCHTVQQPKKPFTLL